jgi:hypothetical protein
MPHKRIQDGILVWCDEAGNEFCDDKVLKTAKHRGMAYLRTSENYACGNITGLPTPFELTGDPRWDEGGDLLKLYDLELERRTAVQSVLGCSGVFNTTPNTFEKKEFIENIEESGVEDDRVRVLGQNSRGEENIFEKPHEGPEDGHGGRGKE